MLQQYKLILIFAGSLTIQIKYLILTTMSKQLTTNESAIASSDDIATLLDFQQRLLNLVHSQLYSHQIVDDDIIVKFQINYVTEMNQSWKRMVEDLHFRLVKQKIPYQSTLRDHFHKALTVDFLPFLRINKHELTQVSLYGFDIYVEPLSAMLQIINRIDGQIHILSKQLANNPQELPWFEKPRDIWQSIKKGWNQFIYQSSLCKISLNIYILNQYLKIAAKSLVKKDKEIIFTGCCNLFNEIVPILKRNKQIWLLCQFSDLNNQLYQFHPSFSYSHFYSLILPLRDQYESIFRATKFIGQKCLSANILTPLLFAVLRHKESFHQFIDQTDDKCWTPYLNGIVFGLIYNFKARILQYEQSMEILKSAILKLGVFGALQTSYFTGQLGKQWSEARDFFISALKVGYNVGQLQTWHPIDFPTIQQRIISYSKSSLLMHPELPANVPIKLFFPNGFQKQLEECLQQLTGSLLSKQQLTTNFSPNIAQAVAINENSIYSLLRLSLLINQCKLTGNIHCLCYILSFLNKVEGVQSKILVQRLTQIGDNYCSIAIRQLQKQQKNRQDLKEVLFTYIKKNKPIAKIDQIIRVCLMISTPKEATLEILSIIETSEADDNLCKVAAANILSIFTPERLDGDVKVKTFEKQYSIQNEIINTNSKLHSCLNILVESIIERDSVRAIQTLMWMSRMSSWIVIPLLSLPVSSRYDRNQPNKKLQSFGMWLIGNPRYHGLLLQLLSLGFNQTNRQIKTYFMEICLIGICDQTIMQINRVLGELTQMQDNQVYKYILQLLQLLTLVYRQSSGPLNLQLIQKIVKLYLRSLQKIDVILSNNQDQNATKQIIISIKQLYCPLIDHIFTANNINSKKWRTCMRKICLTSLDINVEHVSNVRDFELPTIRKDKGFLINNSVEQAKDKDTYVSTDRLKKRAETLYNEGQKYKYTSAFEPKERLQQKPEYLTSTAEIQGLKLAQIGDIFYSKEYLLPSLSLKTIKQLLTHCKPVDFPLIVELLSMTPSNHRKLTEWALLNSNKQIIKKIGITKQTVSSLLFQILMLMQNQQNPSLTSSLDQSAKKTISDNFNLMLMRQQMQGKDGNKDKQLISDLSKELGFLLVLNQSNWRYANELINQLASSKMSSFASTPSLLLQYLEYIRITSGTNQDYETKVQAYLEVLLSYESLLRQKHEYLQQLESQSRAGKGNRDEVISEEQIRLFKVNQLGYISNVCQSWCLKDFLYRAAYLRTEIAQLTTEVAKFSQIFGLIDSVVQCLANINKIVNSIARGHVMSPNFINSYTMCSSNAFTQFKIQLGENIQSYYRCVGHFTPQLYTYLPEGEPAQVKEYLQATVQSIPTAKDIPQNVKVEIKNKTEHNVKKLINQKYEMLHKYLLDQKVIVISEDKQSIQIVRGEPGQQQKIKQENKVDKYLFYYGLLYKAMELTGQKRLKLDKLLDSLKQRQVLSWEMLKDYDGEAYHHIKSVLIDEQIQSRKLKFVFMDKALVPQGPNIEVNKLNRQRYCNLVGKAGLGLDLLEKGSALTQGYHSII